MKGLFFFVLIFMLGFSETLAQGSVASRGQGRIGASAKTDNVMSQAYWDIWNPDVQSRIDRDIELHRKANATLRLVDLPVGSEVKVEQVSHDFIFGANIFNFNQLGTVERNRKYKELFGTLFNSATIPFYWKTFEMEPNRPRFREEYWDTEEYWNQTKVPEMEPHWRRPATDPIVEFCESKGIRLHGHNIIWGNRRWQHPEWLVEQFATEDEKKKIDELGREEMDRLSPKEIAELAPVFSKEMRRIFEKRVVELAEYYGDRLDSWDVVNESATDFRLGRMIPGDAVCKSHYGLMPGDYAFEAFKTADRVFPSNVLFNINDYTNDVHYLNQVNDLRTRGCRIDIMGSQMHLFNPQQCLDIANGKPIETPEIVWKKMETLGKAGLPIHLSEITITSPGDDERGREIQAIIARNLYRLWFSLKPMMGITWWNVVDGCGAPGEPAISGLFTRDMKPKPAFYALNKLINEEWKTRKVLKVGSDGIVQFRGFKGRYQVVWKDKYGVEQKAEFYLKEDGDGFQTF